MNLAKALLKDEIKQLEQQIKKSLKSDVFLLNLVMNYLVNQKGKMIRPYFVFLSALIHGKITPATFRAATAIELLHTATLIHDDVVDHSDKRRGLFSVPTVWKNKIAVLAGDFMLSKGLLVLLEHKEFETLTIISTATKKMAEGELLQLQKGKISLLTEKEYLQIIEGKTASLFASACEVGAYSVLENHDKSPTMMQLGNAIGMAFQIKDDLLDISLHNIGKPRGQDLKEKKMTLPVIHALNQSSFLEKRKFKTLLKKAKTDDATLQQIIQFVHDKGGVQYAEKVMESYTTQAKNILDNYPQSKAYMAFMEIIDFIIQRKK